MILGFLILDKFTRRGAAMVAAGASCVFLGYMLGVESDVVVGDGEKAVTV
jgi:hypothetical protein